jgi:hypothetical protein
MTLDAVRAAAIDRALIDDDPEPALALAGMVDAAGPDAVDNPFAAAMLAVRSLAVDADRSLDGGAWAPGTDPDPFVLAGAAIAVQSRGLSLDRAADLANCSPAALDAVVERRKKE